MASKRFMVEGNKGGDCIELEHVKDNVIRIKSGHCCVYSLELEIPIEVLTVLFNTIFCSLNEIEKARQIIKGSGWPEDYIEKLLLQIQQVR